MESKFVFPRINQFSALIVGWGNYIAFTKSGARTRYKLGTPNGSYLAQFMAILFLYYFDDKQVFNSRKSYLHKACRFTNVFYFTDDLYAVIEICLFETHFREIYIGKLEFKRENVWTSFLNIGTEIRDKILTFI